MTSWQYSNRPDGSQVPAAPWGTPTPTPAPGQVGGTWWNDPPATAVMSATATLAPPALQPVPPALLPVPPGPGPLVPSAGYPAVAPSTVEYASFWTRLAARIIDLCFCLVFFVPLLAGAVAVTGLSVGLRSSEAITLIVLLALWMDVGLWELAYYLVGASRGQTVGKRLMGIRVCREDGMRLGLGKATGRSFASTLSSLAFGIGWLAPLWTPKRQTWQDSMTGTIVIRDPQARLAGRAVVWGIVWTLASAIVLGLPIGLLLKQVEATDGFTSYDTYSTYDTYSSYDTGYGD